jgi:DNA mismatch repair ATPase MutS
MKAFLMYRDRDFDRQQILARRDKNSYARNADESLNLEHLLPWNEPALTQDLGLDILFSAMALGDKFLFEVAKVGLLSSVNDVDTILYRQRALQDCSTHEATVREIYQIAIEAIAEERKNYWSSFGRYPGGTLSRAVDVLQMLVGKLRRLRRIADQGADKVHSEAFAKLFAMLKNELDDDYFAVIERHLKQLKFRQGVLISAALGKGNKGTDYVLRKSNVDRRSWITRLLAERPPAYTFRLHPRDEAGARALSELRDQGINLVANALAQSTEHILSFLQMLRTELAFYIGCLNLQRQLVELGEPTCFPMPVAAGERKLSFRELYEVCLALSAGRQVVGNDLTADGTNIVIITGANTGGKSTFLRSVGLANLMMQAGMFVPAKSFSSEIADGVFTHYKREEDTAMESGKWDEELGRMSEIVDHLNPNSIVLFNESFASTNEREGSEIARQIVKALLEKRVRVFFVTHMYHFARGVCEQKMAAATFLRAERRSDGTRPYKLIEAEPLQTSYGEDLYRTIFKNDRLSRQSQELGLELTKR